MDYSLAILTTAPRLFKQSLELSERIDGHRRHSMLSLAVELGVYPDRVLDAVQQFQAALTLQDRSLDAWDLEHAAYTGSRYGGAFDLPDGHPEGDHTGDFYLTDDAIVYVLEQIRPPAFIAPSPAIGRECALMREVRAARGRAPVTS